MVNSALLNDGTRATPIVAPYVPPIANYAVEANIQVVSQKSSPAFGIFLRGDPSDSLGYVGGITGYFDADGYNDSAAIGRGDIQCPYSPKCIAYDPGSGRHTYRVEARGNDIRLLIDGGLQLDLADNTYLQPGRAGLWCRDAQITVNSFAITAL